MQCAYFIRRQYRTQFCISWPENLAARRQGRGSLPFRSRLAEAGFDVSLSLQPVEGGIDCANGDFASSARLDFLAYGDSVSFLAQTHKRQDDYVLEPAEVITVHYIYNSELIEFPATAGNRNSLAFW